MDYYTRLTVLLKNTKIDVRNFSKRKVNGEDRQKPLETVW